MEDDQDDNSHFTTMDETAVPAILPITSLDATTHIVTLTGNGSSTMDLQTQMDSTPEWAEIAAENNTLISFRSLPIHLNQLDEQTQLAIRQNLGEDPTSRQDTILSYDPISQQVVANSVDMVASSQMTDDHKVLAQSNGEMQVEAITNSVISNNGTVLLLQDKSMLPQVSVISNTDNYQEGTSDISPEPNNISTPTKTSVVFCRVSATLSTEAIQNITDYKSLIFGTARAEADIQMEMTEDSQLIIHGSLDYIVRLNNKLQKLLNSDKGQIYSSSVRADSETVDTPTQCDLLVPHISSRGRQVHQPSRYTGFYKDPVSDIDVDSDDQADKKEKRKNRGRNFKTSRRNLKSLKNKNNLRNGVQLNKDDGSGEANGKPYYKFSCTICSFKTLRPSHFQKHQRIHENRTVELYKCKKCPFVTIRLSHLHRHELQHSSVIYRCDLCSYTTNQQFYLTRHKRYKHPATKHVYSCTDCNFQTLHRNNFTRHQKLHMSPVTKKMFECECCSYKTDVSARYHRHLKHVHGDARPFLCDHCGKAFKRTDTLKAHKVTHLARKDRILPFVCEICSKGFRSKAHLKEHEISHKKERPYLCHLCGASFKTQSVQKKHISTIHINPRAYTCELCNKRFNTSFTLARHKRTHDANNASQIVEQIALDVAQQGQAESLQQTGNESLVSDPPQQPLVQDVIHVGVSIDEPFDQSADGLRQTYTMPSNETAAALFYLSENLPI